MGTGVTRSWRLVVLAALASACLIALARAEAAFGPLGQDERISFMGQDGSALFETYCPSVAHNEAVDEYLVVWRGDDDTPPLVNNEFEIFGQRLSGSGARLGQRIRISAQGADGDPASEAWCPSVAYNATSNQYLVVWPGELGTTNEYDIWGRRLSATGERLGGADDLQISQTGALGDAAYGDSPGGPSVAANPTSNEYLVVWQDDIDVGPPGDDEWEIFGQRLTAEGAQTGADDFRISQQGADGNPSSLALMPSVAYNDVENEYLVAWEGNIGTSGEYEIWGQRLTALGGVAKDDFQISHMGPPDNPEYDAGFARIATNTNTGEYLVVWRGDGYADPTVNDEFEIFGQRLSGSGASVGGRIRVSGQGLDGDPASGGVFNPSVAYDPTSREYLVVWDGEIGTSEKYQVWAQRLSAKGDDVGGNDFQVSHIGPHSSFFSESNDVAASPTPGEFLVVWSGEDDSSHENEIYGHRLGVPSPTLVDTDPSGVANHNTPRVKGSVAADATVDVFTNASCAGAPAVNDAPAAELTGAGVAVRVPDNSLTKFSATASSDGHTSRCSNSIFYIEVTPPAPPPPPTPPPPPPPPGTDAAPVVSAFAVSPRRIRAGGRATFRFRLSERATARIVIERTRVGRKKRVKRAAALSFAKRPAGQNRVGFRARRLKPGAYRATIVATDVTGNRSLPRRASFRIVRR